MSICMHGCLPMTNPCGKVLIIVRISWSPDLRVQCKWWINSLPKRHDTGKTVKTRTKWQKTHYVTQDWDIANPAGFNMHFDFTGNGNFKDLIDFTYWWRSIGKGLLPKGLQHLIFVPTPLYPWCFMSLPLCNKAILLPTIGHFHRLYHMSPHPYPHSRQ